uniref:Thrombospondin type-1 domain-containing protein 1 n=1 Tax=Rhabditophanes sp. KR3021 TaxID=114890 RepID=A0AC35TRT7_9BILA
MPHALQSTEVAGLTVGGSYLIQQNNITTCRFSAKKTRERLPCGCFGIGDTIYNLFSINDKEEMKEVKELLSKQPGIKIKVPLKHDLLTDLEISFEAELCSKQVFKLIILFRPFYYIPSNLSFTEDDSDQWEPIEERSIQLHSGVTTKTMSCRYFNSGGLYKFKLIQELNLDTIVSITSHSLALTPQPNANGLIAGKPSINIRSDSVFPHCDNYFTLSWENSICPNTNLNFRVQVTATMDLRKVRDWHYVEELLLPSNQKTLDLDCSLFDIIFEKYCFELISTHTITERSTLWDKKCVKTEPLKRIDGSWSNWANFPSTCSTSCGPGIRKRTRSCDNPKPAGGLDCVGPMMEVEVCELKACPQPLISSNQNINSSCACGCDINEESGTFFVGRGTGPFCQSQNKITWKLTPPQAPKIRNKFFDVQPYRDFALSLDTHYLAKSDVVQIFQDNNLVWESRQSHEKELHFSANKSLLFILQSGRNVTNVSGVIVNYMVKDSSYSLNHYRPSNLFCVGSYCERSLMIMMIAVIILFILFFPTTICFLVTKSVKDKEWAKAEMVKSSLLSKAYGQEKGDSMPSDMIKSNNTDSTHLTIGGLRHSSGLNKKVVHCRSIGIQLSSQNTPLCSRSIKPVQSTSNSSRNTPRVARSSLSFASVNEMEYDYYDEVLPGSIFHPTHFDLSSDIDIDSIIRKEAKVLLGTDTTSAHTQI